MGYISIVTIHIMYPGARGRSPAALGYRSGPHKILVVLNTSHYTLRGDKVRVKVRYSIFIYIYIYNIITFRSVPIRKKPEILKRNTHKITVKVVKKLNNGIIRNKHYILYGMELGRRLEETFL